jgi:putative PEP-CTERM system histidine kinase
LNLVGALSYGLASAAFLLLALLLIASARARSAGIRLIVASLATSLWSGVLAMQSWTVPVPPIVIYLLEMSRDASWLMALVGLNRSLFPRPLVTGARALSVGLLALGPALLVFKPAAFADASAWPLVRGGLAMAIFGMIAIEQLYRNANASARWALRPLVIGVGLFYAYDLYLYSQAELLKGIGAQAWVARGMVSAIAVPLLAIAARRSPTWSLDVFVSRQAVFYAGTCLAAGAYLTAIAAIGYYLRAFGGTWGSAMQISFIAGASVVLVVSVASVELRRRVKVFIATHFYRNKYDYRIEWLRFVNTLSGADEADVRQTAVRAIAEIFESPAAVLFTLDEGGQALVPGAAWPARLQDVRGLQKLPVSCELYLYLKRSRRIIDLAEFLRVPESYENVELPDWLRSPGRWRVLMPILHRDRLVGLVLLEAPPGTFELTYEDRDLMRVTGQHVAVHIAQQEADHRLADARQFEAYNRLGAFMMHDLKNSAAQMQLIVANAQRHKHNPAFIDDAIGTIANAVARINGLIQQIKGETPPQPSRYVDLDTLVKAAVRRCGDRLPAPALLEVQNVRISADPARLESVLEHIIRNAQDATPPDGQVTVTLKQSRDGVQLTIHDTGCGMDSEFLSERLFRPFDSTKGSQGMGIGAYQAREYVRALGGDVEVSSAPGAGTRFSIRLPLASTTASRTLAVG